MNRKTHLPVEWLRDFCRKNGIRKLSLFGSTVKGNLGPDSDMDILVEFEPGRTPGLIRLSGLELELGEIAGRKVDLRTPAELSRYFREDVLAQAEVRYEA
ncbi:MAG: nucleotidyltransferase family protein [Pseudomonadota bacterium]